MAGQGFIRELSESLLPGKASWPQGSWQSVTVLLTGTGLTFAPVLAANIFGIVLIVVGGAFLVGICLTQPSAGKRHERRARYRVCVSLLLTLAVLSLGAFETAVHVLSASEARAAQIKRRAIREQLGSFLDRGPQLMSKAVEATRKMPMEGAPKAEAEVWGQEITSYLRQNLDESFVRRFNNPPHVNLLGPIGSSFSEHQGVYQWVQNRTEQLRLFIAELKD